MSQDALSTLVGAYAPAGAMQTGLDLSQYDPDAVIAFASCGRITDAASAARVVLLMLGNSAIGAVQTAVSVTQQATAIAAYKLVRVL